MKKLTKKEQAQKAAYETILAKHNLLCATVDQLFSALYEEFGINDTDIILDAGEVVDYITGTEQWADTDNNREILDSYYEYAAECAAANA